MNDWRTNEALHRYAVIREAADARLKPSERGALVRAAAARLHPDPFGRLRSHGRSTLDDWIRAYRRGGFEALKPKLRESGPLTDPAILKQAVELRREEPGRSGAQIAAILAALHGSEAPSVRTVQRYLAHKGLRRGQGASERVGFGRFEAERPNELWVADALHGPVAATQRGGNVKLSQAGFDGDPETRIPTWKKGTPKPCHDRRSTPTSCSIAAPGWSPSPAARSLT